MTTTTARNIVLTGAARGIGRAIARHLYLAGHKLFLIDVDEAELSYTVNEHLPAALAANSNADTTSPNRLSSCTADLRKPAAIQEAINAAAKFLDNRIDVLINNAGIARAHWPDGKTMEDDVLDEWQAYVETNLTAPFILSRACLPYMKACDAREPGSAVLSSLVAGDEKPEPDACIINISSFRARQSQPNCEGYGASKAGLSGLTHAMAMSGAQWGIGCNAILPGYIEVKHECREGDEKGTRWAERISVERHRTHPVGRVGRGEDIAKAVEWLMGAGFVTGQEIVVDGGVSKIKFESS
jgi:NAD(P)-dependent dehydrogenase (short-subunit alcohol dehydrogenase family)